MDSLYTIATSLTPLIFFFLNCDFGDYLSQQYSHIGDAYYEASWYVLPLDMQKNWPIVIGFGQLEVGVQGLGNTHCNRVLYLKVCKMQIVQLDMTKLYSVPFHSTDHQNCILWLHAVS